MKSSIAQRKFFISLSWNKDLGPYDNPIIGSFVLSNNISMPAVEKKCRQILKLLNDIFVTLSSSDLW